MVGGKWGWRERIAITVAVGMAIAIDL